MNVFNFFLDKGWQIEGKLRAGFKTIRSIRDYKDEIHYFWGFPMGIDFVSEYLDDKGNRRIAYNRNSQLKLDYIEVFLDKIEKGHFIYRKNQKILRQVDHTHYGRDWANHGRDLIRESFLEHGEKYINQGLQLKQHRFHEQKRPWNLYLLPGDLLLFSTIKGSKINNHAGIYTDYGVFIHCLERKGVFESELSWHWRSKLNWILRIYNTTTQQNHVQNSA